MPSTKREAVRFTSGPVRAQLAGPTCACGGHVTHARTTDGDDIVLDATANGLPSKFTRSGTFVEVATTPDILGRRALLVQPSLVHGQYRRHRCPTLAAAG